MVAGFLAYFLAHLVTLINVQQTLNAAKFYIKIADDEDRTCIPGCYV